MEHPHPRIVIDFGFRAVVHLTSQRDSGYATVNSCVVREYVIGQYTKERDGKDKRAEREREREEGGRRGIERRGEGERKRGGEVYRNIEGGLSDKVVMLDRSKCSR